jgi:hypothetical protein
MTRTARPRQPFDLRAAGSVSYGVSVRQLDESGMIASPDRQDRPPFWRRRRRALIAGLALMMLVAAGLAAWLAAPSPVTPADQQIARQALRDPSGAPLHLGDYGDDTPWLRPDVAGYAVQDGLVIFPEPDTQENQAALGLAQIELPVLVYAPAGGDLSTRPGPPTDRYIAANEWFLTRCRPVFLRPSWWECGLLFGSLTHQ